ncbi:MAG: glycosyltransferase [Paludibacteraceae bacterium]|nr:glycosyltransferase [Paludibacteraceae bacterium]
MKPLVSIVCIAYNHEPYIRECLESFVTQKVNFPIEILVNDDCSKDNTALIIREYEQKYPDLFKCVYQNENQYSKGVQPWFDILFPMVQGKYIALCEGDDYWVDPMKLQKQIEILEKDETLVGCYTDYYDVDLDGKRCYNGIHRATIGRELNRISLRDFFTYNVSYPTASVVFRNNHAEEVIQKVRHMKNPYLGDWVLWIALHCFGDFYYLDEITSAYRFNPTSVTHTQWVMDRVGRIKMEFDLQPRIADVLPEEYADIAVDLRNTKWAWLPLAKAYFKNKQYVRMMGALIVYFVKNPRNIGPVLSKIWHKVLKQLKK